ncbi:MAG: DUF1571 domain-containing protein, partial [Planctomycetota bacterium]
MSRPVVARPSRSAGSTRSAAWRAPLLLAAAIGGLSVPLVGAQETGAATPKVHPLKKAIRYAQASQQAAEALPSYTATLRRREIVAGQPIDNTVAMKFRAEPFSVYMRFTNRENDGRQVLYVEGANDGKIMVREAAGLSSLAGTVNLAPDSPLIAKNSRHPITRAGLANLAGGVIDQWTKESRYGECDVKYFANAELNGRPVVVIESSHPVPRREFRYARTRLWMDKETRLPVRLQQYEFRRDGG